MAWNADTYNKFKSERFAPFYDLLDLATIRPGLEVIDLGCGTGELTKKLADFLPQSNVLGIDSSEQMLKDSNTFAGDHVKFECRSIENQIDAIKKWDLIFSNAAIQWVDDHKILLPKIISLIKENGQLLIQIPSQHHNITNKLLNEVADEDLFRSSLKNRKRISSVLEIDEYAQIFFENGSKKMTLYEKIYPLVLKDTDALFDWVSGTALIPYLEKLPGELHKAFINEYKTQLQYHFKKSPVFYPFKRIIMEASF
jgi:trans-aconitate 2-methyltransferase